MYLIMVRAIKDIKWDYELEYNWKCGRNNICEIM